MNAIVMPNEWVYERLRILRTPPISFMKIKPNLTDTNNWQYYKENNNIYYIFPLFLIVCDLTQCCCCKQIHHCVQVVHAIFIILCFVCAHCWFVCPLFCLNLLSLWMIIITENVTVIRLSFDKSVFIHSIIEQPQETSNEES